MRYAVDTLTSRGVDYGLHYQRNRDIIEVVVNRIAFVEHDRKILYVAEKGVGEYSIMFVDDIYTTKAEAEAKLKELQGDRE